MRFKRNHHRAAEISNLSFANELKRLETAMALTTCSLDLTSNPLVIGAHTKNQLFSGTLVVCYIRQNITPQFRFATSGCLPHVQQPPIPQPKICMVPTGKNPTSISREADFDRWWLWPRRPGGTRLIWVLAVPQHCKTICFRRRLETPITQWHLCTSFYEGSKERQALP